MRLAAWLGYAVLTFVVASSADAADPGPEVGKP
jgi:hypothetical protein